MIEIIDAATGKVVGTGSSIIVQGPKEVAVARYNAHLNVGDTYLLGSTNTGTTQRTVCTGRTVLGGNPAATFRLV
jgi:hypothetical protein